MPAALHIRALAAHGRRSAFLLLSALAVLGSGACDDATEPTDDILGTWVLETEAGVFYLDVAGEQMTVYMRLSGSSCFTFRVYRIAEVDGNRYTLVEEGLTENVEADIQRDGDGIRVDGEVRYEPTTDDLDGLEICSLALTCLDLPTISLPADIDGSLGPGDPQLGNGTYIDPIAFELEATTTVEIEMTSGAFDTFVTLFDGETGEFLAENDDGGTDTDSRITRTLDAGCYMVTAGSYFPDTGAYTLTIEAR